MKSCSNLVSQKLKLFASPPAMIIVPNPEVTVILTREAMANVLIAVALDVIVVITREASALVVETDALVATKSITTIQKVGVNLQLMLMTL